MDGAPINEVATPPPAECEAHDPPGGDESVAEPIDLALHKRRLMAAARAIDPLKPLRRHPVLTVVVAAALGLVAASPAAARAARLPFAKGLISRLSRMASSGLLSYIAAMRVAQAKAAPSGRSAESPAPASTDGAA